MEQYCDTQGFPVLGEYFLDLAGALLSQLVWVDTRITFPPRPGGIVQNGNHRYALIRGLIDLLLQRLLSRTFQQDPIHLYGNAHIHEVRHGISERLIYPPQLHVHILVNCLLPYTDVDTLSELGLCITHGHHKALVIASYIFRMTHTNLFRHVPVKGNGQKGGKHDAE